LVAPALSFSTIDRVVVWSYVLLVGVPLTIMAIILATTCAQYGLVNWADRATALVWAASALLVLTPFEVWVPQGASVVHWARIIAAALVALLFVGSALRVGRLPGKQRFFLSLGFGAVALFFGDRARRYILPTDGTGLEAATEALAEFFLGAVLACVLLLPGLVAGWIVRRRVHESPAG
jgi:hypothetical protein